MGIMSSIFGKATSNDVQNSTTSTYNSSDIYSTVDSHNMSSNTTNNLSSNSTENTTNTLTQDRRLVNDHGIGITADDSSIYTRDSNNTSSLTNISGSGNTTSNFTSTDFGAVSMGSQVALAGIKSNAELAGRAIDVGRWLGQSAVDMQSMNLNYASAMAQGAIAEARNAIREVTAASGNAMNQVVGLAGKPITANDSQNVLVIVGLVVVGVVLFKTMGK